MSDAGDEPEPNIHSYISPPRPCSSAMNITLWPEHIVSNARPEISGSIGFSTLMICRQVEVLPHVSDAVQVRLIVYPFGVGPLVVTSLKVTSGEGSQESNNVGVPVLSGKVFSMHSIVTSAGQVIVGGAVSSIVMIWMQVALFPHVSVVVHVLVIIYSWGQDPPTVISE